MKQILLSITVVLVLTLTLSAKSQRLEVKKVDFDSIGTAVNDPKSKFYYPRLLENFLSNDTVLKHEDYRHLYYGYTFQEDYDPVRMSLSDYPEGIRDLYYKKDFTRAECDTIIKYAELTLRDNIFDLNQMNFYIFALKKKEKNTLASIRQYKLNHLVAAILSSGNGSKEKPWVVISVSHEYNLLNMLGFVATGHKDEGNNIDYIMVEQKDKNSPEGFYFDISRINEVTATKYKEE